MTKSKTILCNEDRLIQEEKERLKKLRLLQVREKSKQNAAKVRNEFRQAKEKEIKIVLEKHKVTIFLQVSFFIQL
jgi:capsular polysaccharide biosynthesis protein